MGFRIKTQRAGVITGRRSIGNVKFAVDHDSFVKHKKRENQNNATFEILLKTLFTNESICKRLVFPEDAT